MTNSDVKRLKGVNLGGWLVVEKWMTPSLFSGTDAIDEYTLSQSIQGRAKITKHRRTFIQEEDIKWLKDRGVSLVRIPVGFWLFVKSSPYASGTEQLDKCMQWCEKYDMKVILDLHGAPGSQNGNDHSGRVGKIGLWSEVTNQGQTLSVLEIIAHRYGNSTCLWGIQLLNEPHVGVNYLKLIRFYRIAYDRLEPLLPATVKIIYSDGFRPRLMNGVLRGRHRAVMDTHHYQFGTMFRAASRYSLRLYTWRLARRKKMLKRLARTQPVMIGEWSAVLGHDLLEREKISKTAYSATWLPWHLNIQHDVFSSAIITCYWTYKTEGGGYWSFRSLVEKGEAVL